MPDRSTKEMVKVSPRDLDLRNAARLKSSGETLLVKSLGELEAALARRKRELHG
jgi:hypothetical protein